ncbi:MAG: hypothetical protein LCH30_00580 [Proteobacteria bacterium]|nr:hypothetical protein [Pseudomonadota bacterium]
MKNQFFQPSLNDVTDEILFLIPIPDLVRMASTTKIQDRRRLFNILFQRSNEPIAQRYIQWYLRKFTQNATHLIPPKDILLKSLEALNFTYIEMGTNLLKRTLSPEVPFSELKKSLEHKAPIETLQELARKADTFKQSEIIEILHFMLKELLKEPEPNSIFQNKQNIVFDTIDVLLKYLSGTELLKFKDYFDVENLFSSPASSQRLKATVLAIFVKRIDKNTPELSPLIDKLLDNFDITKNKKVAFYVLSIIMHQLNSAQKKLLLAHLIHILENKNDELFTQALTILPEFDLNEGIYAQISNLFGKYLQDLQREPNKQQRLAKTIPRMQNASNFIYILFGLFEAENSIVKIEALLSLLSLLESITKQTDKEIFLHKLILFLTNDDFYINKELEIKIKIILDNLPLTLNSNSLFNILSEESLSKLLNSRRSFVVDFAIGHLLKHPERHRGFILKELEKNEFWPRALRAEPIILPLAKALPQGELQLWSRIVIENQEISPPWQMGYLLALVGEPNQTDERKNLITLLLNELHTENTSIALMVLSRLHYHQQLDTVQQKQLFNFFIEEPNYWIDFWKNLPLFPDNYLIIEKQKIVKSIVSYLINATISTTSINALKNNEAIFKPIPLLAEKGQFAELFLENLIKSLSETTLQPYQNALGHVVIIGNLTQLVLCLLLKFDNEDSKIAILTSMLDLINNKHLDVKIRELFINVSASWVVRILEESHNQVFIDKIFNLMGKQQNPTAELARLLRLAQVMEQIAPKIIQDKISPSPSYNPN